MQSLTLEVTDFETCFLESAQYFYRDVLSSILLFNTRGYIDELCYLSLGHLKVITNVIKTTYVIIE